ncbi:MAG: CHAD domain-containing protein [Pseudoxanthomonas sp.]|nr:CHAD domain-containing protein [Pseudoxanthomonas sp.]
MPSSPGSRLGHLLRQECLAALKSLATAGDQVHAHVHEARKAIRRARSLAALVASGFDVESADGILQRTGDSLSPLRDAHVVALVAGRLGKRPADPHWKQAAATLEMRAERLVRRELAADPGFARRRRALRRAAKLLEPLPWRELKDGDIREALVRQSRRVERAARRAKKDPTPDNLHRWRRRVRRLRMQLDALDSLGIDAIGHDPAASKRLHRLGDRLGARQDLVVLAGVLRRLRTLPHRRELLRQLDEKIAAP